MELRSRREGPSGSERVRGPRGSKSSGSLSDRPSGVAEGARRPRAAPLPPPEDEIAALDHACKPATIRSRRARSARRVGILAQAPVPISREVVGVLIDAGLLAHEDRCHRAAIVKAAQEYWRLHFGL